MKISCIVFSITKMTKYMNADVLDVLMHNVSDVRNAYSMFLD